MSFAIEILLPVRSKESKLRHTFSVCASLFIGRENASVASLGSYIYLTSIVLLI